MVIVGSPWTAHLIVGSAFWKRWNLDSNRPRNVGFRIARRG